ncbi:MAG: universal stress protein [Thermovirgaceae bacterium]|nr:universal stress protein [Thermovirgaceae bacterium]
MKKVVVAIDGSEVSRGVIDHALHYAAREKDAELLFIHVVDGSEYKKFSFGNFSVSVPPSEEEVKTEFCKFIEEQIKISGIAKPASMSFHVATGSPYDKIVSFAEKIDADMIMIGHRGLSDMGRFFLGSVASKVVAHAPCSVYVHRLKSSAKKG